MRLHLLRNPWGCLCALSEVKVSKGVCAMYVNTNREITTQSIYRYLEFTRCIAVGKETERNAQVDDTLEKNE